MTRGIGVPHPIHGVGWFGFLKRSCRYCLLSRSSTQLRSGGNISGSPLANILPVNPVTCFRKECVCSSVKSDVKMLNVNVIWRANHLNILNSRFFLLNK